MGSSGLLVGSWEQERDTCSVAILTPLGSLASLAVDEHRIRGEPVFEETGIGQCRHRTVEVCMQAAGAVGQTAPSRPTRPTGGCMAHAVILAACGCRSVLCHLVQHERHRSHSQALQPAKLCVLSVLTFLFGPAMPCHHAWLASTHVFLAPCMVGRYPWTWACSHNLI